MITGNYEADIPGGRSRGFAEMHIEVGNAGGTVTIGMKRVDGRFEPLWTELTTAETKKLIEGLLDASNMTWEERNRFCKGLEIHEKLIR